MSFDTNGGSEIKAVTVKNGETVSAPAEPTRAGFTFRGWYTDKLFLNKYDFSKPVTSDTILFAKWDQNIYSVTFDLRFGNIGGSEESIVKRVVEGSLVERPATDPQKDGYTFMGWYKDGAITQPWDFAKDTVTKTTTLYAGWEINSDGTFYENIGGNELRFQILDGTNVRVIRNDHGDYTQISGDLVIPETVAHEGVTYTVTEIGNEKDTGSSSTFQNCTGLTSVTIPATVKVLGGNAFCDCANLSSITFAEGSAL